MKKYISAEQQAQTASVTNSFDSFQAKSLFFLQDLGSAQEITFSTLFSMFGRCSDVDAAPAKENAVPFCSAYKQKRVACAKLRKTKVTTISQTCAL